MGVERRILVIGVDGATFDVVGPLVDKGMLPNLGRLMRDGCYGKLLSTIPTLSPVAWTSFATGKNCGKHGIFDFVRRGPGSYRMLVNNASWRRSKPIWVILSERGRSVCVVNVPMSYPPDEVNGYMISGLGTPGTSRDFTYPTWLYEEIRREIGEYIVTPDLHVKMREKISAKEVQDVVEVLSNCIDIRTEAVKYLMKKQSSEFIMVMFGETDLISHMFWESDIEKVICEGSNAIYEIYEKIDNAAGQLIEEIGDESNIIVMSDHGFQPVERCLSVNSWLADRGYLGFKKCVRSRLSRVSRRMTRVGRRLSRRAFSKEAGDRFLKKRRGDEVADLESSVHWEKTSAYSMGSGGNIFVNLRGREPLGVVEPGEEYENLCKSLKEELMALEDPANGNKVVKDVYFKKEIVHGKYTMEAPDILIEYSDGYGNLARGAMRGRIDGKNKAIVKSLWSGRHEINGILIMQGPDVLKGVELDGSSIMDVTPTVLQLMGIPIPADMDGRVLTKALDSRFLATHPEEYAEDSDSEGDLFNQEDLSEEDRQKVVQRLRSLGYL